MYNLCLIVRCRGDFESAHVALGVWHSKVPGCYATFKAPRCRRGRRFSPFLRSWLHPLDQSLSQSQLQPSSSCIICCLLYERHRHVSSAVCCHHLSKLLNQKQSRPSPAVVQRQVVAVGAMCPAMLLRHPIAAGGLWWSVLTTA